PITCDVDSDNNTFSSDTTDYPNATDLGRNNKFEFAGGEQIGNVSRSHGHDYRTGPGGGKGRIEFVDDFLGGPDPRWVRSLPTGGTISTVGAFEGAASPNMYVRRCTINPSPGAGQAVMSLGGTGIVTPRNNPILHLIFNPLRDAAGGVIRIGLADSDFSNGVFLEVGSGAMSLVNAKSGVRSTIS